MYISGACSLGRMISMDQAKREQEGKKVNRGPLVLDLCITRRNQCQFEREQVAPQSWCDHATRWFTMRGRRPFRRSCAHHLLRGSGTCPAGPCSTCPKRVNSIRLFLYLVRPSKLSLSNPSIIARPVPAHPRWLSPPPTRLFWLLIAKYASFALLLSCFEGVPARARGLPGHGGVLPAMG